ncbi:MFS transporter [Alkalicoccus daliensis]|uniref:MFS transporter, NNP family, nitrate/nitrite transporter n=1 Tax=Alkalicoccus daliensis TaxID=745820 RepID=A0A1H0EPL6_9BACI|nr:MFS transporter [Alkalicoccus daliensis]SDN84301.1 MFS transporter, NNP family, nitrate/nitrite transporter [Alkalicoccus daliensis]
MMSTHEKTSRRILILSTFGMALAFTVWASLSPLANQFEALYGLTATEKSILVAVPVLLGSIMRVPAGILADRYGGRKTFTFLLLFTVIPLLGVGFSTSFYSLLFWALLLGVAGASFAVSITFVSKWTPSEKQGTALGINGLGNFGTALAGFTLPTIALLVGLQWTFWVLIIPVVIMAALMWFWTPETPQTGEKKTLLGSLSVLKFRNTWTLSLFYFVTFGAFVAFGIYLPTLLMDLYALSAVDAGMRAAGFVVVATISRPLGGYLGDKIGAGKVLTVVFLSIALGALIISFGMASIIVMTFACLLVAAVTGVGNGAVFKLVPQLFPKATGAVTGLVGAAGGLGGFFPPILLGSIRDITGTYTLGFLCLALLSILCLIINKRQFDKSTSRSFVEANA